MMNIARAAGLVNQVTALAHGVRTHSTSAFLKPPLLARAGGSSCEGNLGASRLPLPPRLRLGYASVRDCHQWSKPYAGTRPPDGEASPLHSGSKGFSRDPYAGYGRGRAAIAIPAGLLAGVSAGT